MLTRIDRVQLAVPDRAVAAGGWVAVLGAERAGDDRLRALAARRTRYRLGDGWLELLEPDGAGPVADAVARRGGHLFAAGVTAPSVDAFVEHLRARHVEPALEHGQAFLDAAATGGHGLRLVVSPDTPAPRVGLVERFYEVTNLVHDAPARVARYADLLGLDPAVFVPIASRAYGYDGTLALFRPDHLDRLEVITPGDPQKTMGRFFARHGESLYMAFAECVALAAVEARARERGLGVTVERDARGAHTVFVHPPALGGMMLGLSRPRYAWRWTGHPERVEGGI